MRFLAVLAETGNRRAAAAAIGVEARLMDQRRRYDPVLDKAWEAAAEEADRRLAGAAGPFERGTVAGLGAIRRGKKGRLQMVVAGKGKWTAKIEAEFLERLRESGNVRAAARAVGFAESSVWGRRRQWPAFAEAMEAVLEEAELALEYRIACMGTNVVEDDETGTAASDASSPAPSPSVAFDLDAAMRFLKWREEKRRGGGRWAPRAKPPSIEEVTETLVRRVEAIRRHREREEAETANGASEDGDTCK